MTDGAKVLPPRVQRLPDNEFVDPRLLTVGQQFILDQKAWTVAEVKENGIDCVCDPTRFVYE